MKGLSKSLKDIESKIIEDKNIILKETLANILEEERRDAAKHEEELYNPYGYDAETMSAMPDIQFSVEKVTPEQVFFDNEIVPQIIDHLKAQGINVYNREKLIEYLKNHDYRKQQMAFEKEMQSIKQKAEADGTFMKAPNGNPTNLTERQWLQVRTKAFKDWFGDWEAAYKTEDMFNLDTIDYSKVDIEEVDKPWKDDPSKSNKTVRIYLKGQHEKGYFELVKDVELGQYSVHFKTSKSGAKFNSPETVESTKEERKTLFKELVKAIPDGAIVSTWGSLSQEGIKGLNNVGREMTKIGERNATLKTDGSHIKIPIFQKR